jgi:8-oxo-dGTP pyrophosphatase MutT (NUDIX family)
MEEGETPLEAAQRELEEEVRHLLRNNEMIQSLMVAPLLKYLSLELK